MPKLRSTGDAAMAPIDHRVGAGTWAGTTPLAPLRRDATILAKLAAGTGRPVVLTSGQEEDVDVQGPPTPALRGVLPEAFAARVRRGTVTARDDPNFAAAVRATGRRGLVMGGVATDVCLVAPAIGAVEEGLGVQVACGACGSFDQSAEEMARRRMGRAGVRLTGTDAVVAELARDRASPAGAVAFPRPTRWARSGFWRSWAREGFRVERRRGRSRTRTCLPHRLPQYTFAKGRAMSKKSVLAIGLEPTLIDFSDPAYGAYPGLDASKVMAGLKADEANLKGLGYDAELCLTDFGETAEAVVRARLEEKPYDCIMIGAGVRLIAQNTPLFEKLINVVHQHAPQARLCFNTRPDDTAAAVQRWIKAP